MAAWSEAGRAAPGGEGLQSLRRRALVRTVRYWDSRLPEYRPWALTDRATQGNPELTGVLRIEDAWTKDRRDTAHDERERGSTMKRFTVAAVAAATVVILFAGKADIRRFHRMRSM